MKRMMKAEFYRFFHDGKLVLLWSLILLFFIAIPFWRYSVVDFSPMKVSDALSRIPFGTYVNIAFILPIFVGYMQGTGKLGYYELMYGEGIHRIIWSKILSLGVFISVTAYLAMMLPYMILGIRNGIGDVEEACVRGGLWIVIIFGVVSSCQLMAVLTRSSAAGVIYFGVSFAWAVVLCIMSLYIWESSVIEHAGELLGFSLNGVRASFIINFQSKLGAALSIAGQDFGAWDGLVLRWEIAAGIHPYRMVIVYTIIGFIHEFVLLYSICCFRLRKYR